MLTITLPEVSWRLASNRSSSWGVVDEGDGGGISCDNVVISGGGGGGGGVYSGNDDVLIGI